MTAAAIDPAQDPPPRAGLDCGDAAALPALVRRHQAGVYRFLRALGAAPHLAEELAVEAFAVAHDKRFGAADDTGLAAALRRTAQLLWLERQRRDGRERERFARAALDLWERTCAGDAGGQRLAALRDCLRALPGRAAAAVRAFYTDGLSRDEAAQRLGLQPNGLKTLLQRVRAQLRECIERRQRSAR